MSTIVVGVDGSPQGDVALAWALREARSLAAAGAGVPPVRAVLAWDLSWMDGPEGVWAAASARDTLAAREAEERTRVEAIVRRVLARMDGDPSEVEAVQVPGPIVTALLEQADGAAMLVVGRRGLGRLGRLLLGSVSAGVARQAHLPVTVVPADEHSEQSPPAAAESGSGRPRVVVGVDGSPASRTALQHAAEAAQRLGAELHAVMCWQITTMGLLPDAQGWVPPEEAYRKHVAGTLTTTLAAAGLSGRDDVVPVVEHAPAARGLLAHAAGAERLVVGSRGLGGFDRLLLGSISSQVLEHATCPVTIIRT
ncbi:universal stress protein [Flavimobilis marinus]|uniref:Nucleotide-binding universal stress protein, UspA family n=1 Tax=Flavimobilis marinus TaxID=285351 RepID=A0A1I2GX07_9MICO|nr:universal stress protein [Flavimobilis marinus]GHG55088.1 universal stress protein [Flavimobilis marinus]SFF21619.1 Nucleotide-binding universal stress protein, UspA family [Flavimobilis marinus]